MEWDAARDRRPERRSGSYKANNNNIYVCMYMEKGFSFFFNKG